MKFREYLTEKELIIRDQHERIVGKRKLKFTKKNIEKIGYEYDAEVQKIEIDVKHAILKDPRGRLLFIDSR